jgi:hypothetical protein
MKTSNKILLIALLLLFAILGGSQLALHAKFRRGEFITSREIFRRTHVKKVMQAPSYLVIKGIRDVNLIPSDTFALEYQKQSVPDDEVILADGGRSLKKENGKETAVPKPRIYRSGDTLVVDGRDTALLLQSPSMQIIGIDMVNVYGLSAGQGTIDVELGQIHLPGSGGQGPDYRVILRSGNIEVGAQTEADYQGYLAGGNEQPASIHSLDISATASGLLFQNAIHIGRLRLDLQKGAAAGTLAVPNADSLIVHLADSAQMNFTGELLRRTRFEKP